MADTLKNAASGAQEGLSSGAQSATNAASSARDTVTPSSGTTASDGGKKWNAMSEDQKKETFDRLPADQKKGKQSYYEWVTEGYHNQYENWMPWIEDKYLSWFTNDNKASYAAKSESHYFLLSSLSSQTFDRLINRLLVQPNWTRRKSPASSKSTLCRTASTISPVSRSDRAVCCNLSGMLCRRKGSIVPKDRERMIVVGMGMAVRLRAALLPWGVVFGVERRAQVGMLVDLSVGRRLRGRRRSDGMVFFEGGLIEWFYNLMR